MKRHRWIALGLVLILVLTGCNGKLKDLVDAAQGGTSEAGDQKLPGKPKSGVTEANDFTLKLLDEHAKKDTVALLVRYDSLKDIPDGEHFNASITLSNLYLDSYDNYVVDLLIAAEDDTRVNILQANDGSEEPPTDDKGNPQYQYPVYLRLLNRGEAVVLFYPVHEDRTPMFELSVSNSQHEHSSPLGKRSDNVKLLESQEASSGPTNSIVYGTKRGDIVVRADEDDLKLVRKFQSKAPSFIEEFQLNESPKDSGYFDEEFYADVFYIYSEESDATYSSRITSAQDDQIFEICTIGEDEKTKQPFIIEILYQQVFHKGESFVVTYNDAKEMPNIAVMTYLPDGRRAQQLLYSPSYQGSNISGDKYFPRKNYAIEGKYAIVGFEDEENLLKYD